MSKDIPFGNTGWRFQSRNAWNHQAEFHILLKHKTQLTLLDTVIETYSTLWSLGFPNESLPPHFTISDVLILTSSVREASNYVCWFRFTHFYPIDSFNISTYIYHKANSYWSCTNYHLSNLRETNEIQRSIVGPPKVVQLTPTNFPDGPSRPTTPHPTASTKRWLTLVLFHVVMENHHFD